MLQTITAYIHKLDIKPFDVYYQEYIVSVQQHNINQEFRYMLNHNVVNLNMIDRAIADACKFFHRMGDYYDNK